MRLRLLAAASLIVLAGCASSSPSPSAPSAPAPSALPSPSSQTITGVVSAGVEPHCLILRDAAGSHSLYFHDEALRSSVPAGARVTLVGHPEPGMMTTCQQGEPFIVTAVRKN